MFGSQKGPSIARTNRLKEIKNESNTRQKEEFGKSQS